MSRSRPWVSSQGLQATARPSSEIDAADTDVEGPVAEELDVHVGRAWNESQWRQLVAELVDEGLVKWEEVASIVLGELNPPQVGTSLASNKNIQAQYEKRKAWQAVKAWFYDQPLGCRECGTLLKLEAEHIKPKETLGYAADRLDNMQLLCKRCNAKKRPSHKNAGQTHLTAEAGLMWLLLTFRPGTYEEFKQLCRSYGMTMADIRFQEAWALAEWLSHDSRYP
jgi:5-methylcytosine-specific restriction endonuclease McrA